MTQPTLSRQMKELENELGTKLFKREGKKTLLTEAGFHFKKRAEEIIELVSRTESDFNAVNEAEVSGDIYIGAGETDAMRYIVRAIRNTLTEHPKIHFHLFSGNAQDVMEKLDHGLLDFGLLIDPVDREKYDFVILPDYDTWGILLRKDHPLANKSRLTPKDVEKLPLLISAQLQRSNWLSGWLGKKVSSINVVATYNLIYNAALMVDEGLDCALTLDKLANISSETNLCFRPLSPIFKSGLVFVWKKNPLFTRRTSIFLNAVKEELA